MRVSLPKLFFSLVLIATIFSLDNVFGCQCYSLATVKQSFDSAFAVFSGKVRSRISKSDPSRTYQFEIIEGFKGVSTGSVTVNNSIEGDMCDYGFLVGESYLVYAYRDQNNELNTHSFCSRNEGLISAQGQIHFLRDFRIGKPEPQVYGSVSLHDNDPKSTTSRSSPMEGFKILVKGERTNTLLVADRFGLFRLNGLELGRYTITLHETKGYRNASYPGSQEFLVLPDRSVAFSTFTNIFPNATGKEKPSIEYDSWGAQRSSGIFVDFTLGWNNRFEGQILDADGKPINNAAIRLVPVTSSIKQLTTSRPYFNRYGRYHLGGTTPGKYLLLGELHAPIGSKDGFSIFYPNVTDRESARVFEILESGTHTVDFMFPVQQRKIEGKVLWSDKTPIRGEVRIVLTASEKSVIGGDEKQFYDLTSLDGASRFSLKNVYVGGDYWVHVIVYADGEARAGQTTERNVITINAKPVRVRISDKNSPLEILVPKPDNPLLSILNSK